ncbi:MAG: hypothetical protein AAFN41_01575 [Planctomycetota bacterium]
MKRARRWMCSECGCQFLGGPSSRCPACKTDSPAVPSVSAPNPWVVAIVVGLTLGVLLVVLVRSLLLDVFDGPSGFFF